MSELTEKERRELTVGFWGLHINPDARPDCATYLADKIAPAVERIIATRVVAHEAQIRDLLEEREELLTEIVRLQRGNHPAGRALREPVGNWHPDHPDRVAARRERDARLFGDGDPLREALTERDAEHEGGGGA